MILETVHGYRYSVPFNGSFSLKSDKLMKREGFVIKICDDEGNEGFGEVAPLTGFSQETIADAEKQIVELMPDIEGEDVPDDIGSLNGNLRKWLKGYKLYPSVQCGVEGALLTLAAKQKNVSLAGLIDPNFNKEININGLLFGDEENVLKQARKLLDQGFRTLKLKIGHLTPKKAAQLVLLLTEETHEQALIRLDANQMWGFEEALEFAEKVGLSTIEYIEEPFKDIKKISEFYERTMIPVALDESLLSNSLEDIRHIEGVDVLILKPMLLGSIEKTWQIAQFAHVIGLKTVLTSSFETSLGLHTIAHLAANRAHYVSYGLDTLKFLNGDILKEQLNIIDGRVKIDQFKFSSSEIDFDKLQSLA